MSQYIMIIIWMIAFYALSQVVNIYGNEYILGKRVTRVRIEFAILAVIPLVWWTATRDASFGDTGYYRMVFDALPSSLTEMPNYLSEIQKDKGFYALGFIIKMIVGNNIKAYFFVLALIQILCVAVVFRKYSSNYIMALFLFIATTDYLSWMHNGIRQFTAVVLIFAATELMLKKKYMLLIAVILLASTIHGSALLMIPIVFVVQGKAWNKKTLLAIVVFAFAIVFVDRFTGVLDTMLTETQYTNVVSDWKMWGDDGTNPLRVFVYAIPTLLSLVGLKYIKAANDPIIDLACNMGVLSTLLYCLSAVTSGVFIGRLPIYCSMYALGILLPWELDNVFTKESARIIKLFMTTGFLLFYYFQIHFAWGLV